LTAQFGFIVPPTQWRAAGTGVDGEPETLAARTEWRAVVRAMFADRFGGSLSINTVSDDWLWHNAKQRDESREERVAKAAFFPVLSLTGSGGYLSGDVSTLFDWDSCTWYIGPSLSLPIFAGGRNRANYQRSQAAFVEATALYRQQILVAFGEVEDSVSGIHYLAVQSEAQERAVTSTRRAAYLATDRYRSGIVAYIEIVDANRDALTAERANAQLANQRLIASVQLIKALGGPRRKFFWRRRVDFSVTRGRTNGVWRSARFSCQRLPKMIFSNPLRPIFAD
jgi:hypothetical protein